MSDDERRQCLIAVVDDDPFIREALVSWLAFEGLHYAAFADAESLIAVAQTHSQHMWLPCVTDGVMRPVYGAVLDFNLTGLNGLALAHTLVEQQPSVVVVLISAALEQELRLHGTRPAQVAYLRKPFELDALAYALLGTIA